MTTLLTRLRDESGQAFVFIAAILTALVGMSALVIDVGSWYQADRRLQTAADAAALAGAQELPLDQGAARSEALQYAQHNYAGIADPTVSFPDARHDRRRRRGRHPGNLRSRARARPSTS